MCLSDHASLPLPRLSEGDKIDYEKKLESKQPVQNRDRADLAEAVRGGRSLVLDLITRRIGPVRLDSGGVAGKSLLVQVQLTDWCLALLERKSR